MFKMPFDGKKLTLSTAEERETASSIPATATSCIEAQEKRAATAHPAPAVSSNSSSASISSSVANVDGSAHDEYAGYTAANPIIISDDEEAQHNAPQLPVRDEEHKDDNESDVPMRDVALDHANDNEAAGDWFDAWSSNDEADATSWSDWDEADAAYDGDADDEPVAYNVCVIDTKAARALWLSFNRNDENETSDRENESEAEWSGRIDEEHDYDATDFYMRGAVLAAEREAIGRLLLNLPSDNDMADESEADGCVSLSSPILSLQRMDAGGH